MLSLKFREPKPGVLRAPAKCAADRWNGNPVRTFSFRLETQKERTMPYLFWAVLPFALMDTWWGVCERRRDTSE
jgi:hypothetical protein